jgi:hypothetical protein
MANETNDTDNKKNNNGVAVGSYSLPPNYAATRSYYRPRSSLGGYIMAGAFSAMLIYGSAASYLHYSAEKNEVGKNSLAVVMQEKKNDLSKDIDYWTKKQEGIWDLEKRLYDSFQSKMNPRTDKTFNHQVYYEFSQNMADYFRSTEQETTGKIDSLKTELTKIEAAMLDTTIAKVK